MKKNILKHLACPKKIKNKTCLGELVLDEVFNFFKSSDKEIKEGYLKCKDCGCRFPVFFGIPILTSDVPKFLKDNFYIILELSKKYGPIDKGLVAESLLLVKQAKSKNKKEIFELTKRQYAARARAIFENDYIINHYDNFLDLAKPDEPLYDFLKKYQNENPHLVLEEFLNTHSSSKDSLALEIGCNVGGFLSSLSQKAKIVFGLDSSFGHLFFASCLLKRLPKSINQYKVTVEPDIKKRRSLNVDLIDNLSLVAGRGDNLPFRDSSLSIVSSCNMIDIIDNPAGLLKEKIRALKKKGLLLSSDPYQFFGENKKRLKAKKGQAPWQRIQEILRPKIKILEERDYIPWITRRYQRHYTIYYNHNFCGRKVC